MPNTVRHPGWHIEETPTLQAVPPVPTSVTAFVGRAPRGPVDHPEEVTSMAEFERLFGSVWTESGLAYAVRAFFANGGGTAIVVRVEDGSTTAEVDLGGGIVVTANGPGSWANSILIGLTHPNAAEATTVAAEQGLEDGGTLFTLWVSCGGATEVFQHVTSGDGPRRLDLVLESSRLVRVRGQFPAARPSMGGYTVTSPGQDGTAPGATAYLAGAGADHGIRALDAVEVVNLLVLPPVTPQGQLPDEVWSHALDYVRERRAFLIVDAPPELAGPAIPTWAGAVGLTGTAARNAALYYPRLEQVDPADGVARALAASGAVAGVYARTDATRGVWRAPAGDHAEVLDVAGPAVAMTDTVTAELNRQGVNVIRSFPGRGTLVWGSRTLVGADNAADGYRYVPVRRLALHIEQSLHRGTQWTVFEPNAEPLWARLRLQVGAFLESLFRQGAFQGVTAREAYFVTCDAETTTGADIAAGVVNVAVGFAPLKPAEFTVLQLQARAAPPA